MRWRKHWSPLDGDWLQFFCFLFSCFCFFVFPRRSHCVWRDIFEIFVRLPILYSKLLFLFGISSLEGPPSVQGMPYSLLPQYNCFCIKEVMRKTSIFKIRPLFFFGNKLWTWTFLCWSYWLRTLGTRGTFLIYSQKNNKPCTLSFPVPHWLRWKWLSWRCGGVTHRCCTVGQFNACFTSFHCRRRDIIATCVIPTSSTTHVVQTSHCVDSDPVDLKDEHVHTWI